MSGGLTSAAPRPGLCSDCFFCKNQHVFHIGLSEFCTPSLYLFLATRISSLFTE